MPDKVFSCEPLNILVDQSRNHGTATALLRMLPQSIFRTVDNHQRLTARRLAEYNVLCICGNSALPYSRRELQLIADFVRRGGTLLLAACAGRFELVNDKPIERLTLNSVASLFGFQFQSAMQLPANSSAVRGFDRKQLTLTPHGRRAGLTMGEMWIDRPGPLAVPAGAKVLMRVGRGGAPVMAISAVGRGTVLACSDLQMWGKWSGWVASHWVVFAAQRRRQRARALPKPMSPRQYTLSRHQGIEVLRGPFTTPRDVNRVLLLARPVHRELFRMVPLEKRPRVWRIFIEPGCAHWRGEGEGETVATHIGSSHSDAAMASNLITSLGSQLLDRRFPWQMRFFPGVAVDYLRIRLLRKSGFGAYADRLAAALDGEAPVDLGRVYTEVTTPRPVRRFWLEVADRFGHSAFSKFVRAVPAKRSLEGIDTSVFTEFDVTCYYLALAVGANVYDWIESQGHTLRRLPLEKPGSAQLKQRVRQQLRRRLKDSNRTGSERFDAAVALGADYLQEKAGLRKLRRTASGKQVAESFAAATALAKVKEPRGHQVLTRYLRSKDESLAATSALLMVLEYQDPKAADRLVELAGSQDLRFKISAGYALRLAGDQRSRRFDKLPKCHMRFEYDGQVKAFPVVDGYEVANVWCVPMVRPTQHGGGFSVYYVAWVHTAPLWRRKGLARAAMAAALDYRWDRVCATTSLHTQTENVAHALYRDCGLVDYFRGLSLEKSLRGEPIARSPNPVRIAPAKWQDHAKVLAFLAAQLQQRPVYPFDPDIQFCIKGGTWPVNRVMYVAWRGAKIVGIVIAKPRGRSAWVEYVSVPPQKDADGRASGRLQEQIGHALLSRAHRKLEASGVKRTKVPTWEPWLEERMLWLLRRSGYGSRLSGGVEMYRINNLAQFLTEIASVLSQGLKESDLWCHWCGSIRLEPNHGQQATLMIHDGVVEVLPRTRSQHSTCITLRGESAAMQRIVMGTSSCFEEYLQIQVGVAPLTNQQTRDLLGVLFPKLMHE